MLKALKRIVNNEPLLLLYDDDPFVPTQNVQITSHPRKAYHLNIKVFTGDKGTLFEGPLHLGGLLRTLGIKSAVCKEAIIDYKRMSRKLREKKIRVAKRDKKRKRRRDEGDEQ